MPIRFRCQHCHQLMGIARRKAGMEVHCPTCQHNVVVPNQDEAPAAAAPQPHVAEPGVPSPLFERSDFDRVLHGPESPRVIRPAPKTDGASLRSPPHGSEPGGSAGVPASLSVLAAPTDIILSPRRATLLAVAAVVLLAAAFGAGLLVGRYCL